MPSRRNLGRLANNHSHMSRLPKKPAKLESQPIRESSVRRNDILSILVLLLLTIVVYNSALLPGQTFLPADLLLLTPPWQQHAAEIAPNFHYVQRPAWDPLFQFYPARKFLADSIHAGRVALWNPLSFSGTPFAADGQSAVFYPINWLFAVLPLAMAFGWVAALHTFLAGLFFWLYCRRMGFSRAASLAGAITWMFAGVLVAWQMWQVVDSTLCWLPLALYFWEGWRDTQSRRQIAGAGVALGMSLLAGHLQFAFYVLFTFIAYALYRSLVDRRVSAPRSLAVSAGMLALGVGVASVQLFATADLLLHSLRNTIPYKEILATALPPSQLITLVAPDFFGGQRDWFSHPYMGTADSNYYEWTAFCGVASLVFAAFGLHLKRPGDRSRFWLGLAVFALLMGCGSPLYAVFYYGVPLFKSFHGAARILVLLDFAVAALCAQGIDRFRDSEAANVRKVIGYTAVALVVLLLLGYRFGATGNGARLSFLLTHNWLLYGITQVGVAGAFLAAAVILIAYAPRKFGWIAVVLVGLDMLRFAYGVNVGVSSSYLFPPTPETQYVSANLGDARVLCLGDGNPAHPQSRLVPNSAMALGWSDISGSDPLFLASYDRFLSALNRAQSGSAAPAGQGIVADAGSPALDRLNVKYIIAPRILPYKQYDLVLPGDVNIYLNPKAAGEARFVNRIWEAPERRALEVLTKKAPPDDEVNVQGNWGGMILNLKAPMGPPPHVLPDEPGWIRIDAAPTANTLLVTSTIYDPGWQVKVDGKPVDPIIADTVFIAVPLTAGAHIVTLRYLPASIQFGLYLTCLAWFAVALLAALPGRPREHGESRIY